MGAAMDDGCLCGFDVVVESASLFSCNPVRHKNVVVFVYVVVFRP